MTLIILGSIVAAIVVLTLVVVARDGYRAVPASRERSAVDRRSDAHATQVAKLG